MSFFPNALQLVLDPLVLAYAGCINRPIAHRPDFIPRGLLYSEHACRSRSSLRLYDRGVHGPYGCRSRRRRGAQQTSGGATTIFPISAAAAALSQENIILRNARISSTITGHKNAGFPTFGECAQRPNSSTPSGLKLLNKPIHTAESVRVLAILRWAGAKLLNRTIGFRRRGWPRSRRDAPPG